MDQVIIFPNAEGGVSIMVSTGVLPIEDVARKDVPKGVPYKIVNREDIPQDRTFRDAWEMGEFTPDGYGDPDGYWISVRGYA